MRPDTYIDALYCILAAVLAFMLVPIYMIGFDPVNFLFINLSTFVNSAIFLTALASSIFVIPVLIFHIFQLKSLSRLYALFIVVWVFVAGFIMPVATSTGMIDPEANPINYVNLFASMLVVSLCTIAAFKSPRLKKTLFIYASVMLVIWLVPAVIAINKAGLLGTETRNQNLRSFSLSNKKNILVISFDGLPGIVVNDLIRQEPDFSNYFKDFIVFDNAVSQHPATELSTLAELYGNHNFKAMGDNEAAILRHFKDTGMSDKLLLHQIEHAYQLGYGFADKAIPLEFTSDEINVRNRRDTFNYFRYPFVRIWTAPLLKRLHWKDLIEPVFFESAASSPNLNLNAKLQNHAGLSWEIKNVFQIKNFESLVTDLHVKEKSLDFKVLHFNFTHHPVDFDKSCSYKSDDKDWYENNQNNKGLKDETYCAINKFISLIDKLKVIDAYDNTLLVFKSDHGQHAYYFDDAPDNLVINGHSSIGYNKYRPSLLIKDFDAQSTEPSFKSEIVLLADLATTLCRKANVDLDCNIFPGIDLFAQSLESDQPYFLYVPENSVSTYRYETHKAVTIPSRKLKLIDAMQQSEQIKLTPYSSPE